MSDIKLFGFQKGRQGFVQWGITEQVQNTYLRVTAGRSSGKTLAGALRAVLYMNTFPGAWGMILAPINDMLNAGVLPKLQMALSWFGLKQGVHWEYAKRERELRFLYNRSIAYLRTTEESENLAGPDLAFFWIDEFRRSPEKAFTELMPTLRQQGFPWSCWLTSTPAGKAHWSRKYWMPAEYAADYGTEPPDLDRSFHFRTYKARTRDNPYGGEQEYRKMLQMYGSENNALFRQEALGEEVIIEGLVYPAWDRDKHLVPMDQWPKRPNRVLAGVDFGFVNPSVILVEGVDDENRRYVVDGFAKTHMDEHELALVAKRMMLEHNIEYFFCDSSDPRWINTFRKAGLPAYPAKRVLGLTSDPSSGLGLCTRSLNGEFFVNPKLKDFTREIENYVHDDPMMMRNPAERPRVVEDHWMDAWRYAEIAISRMWQGYTGVRTWGGTEFRLSA